MKRIHSLEPRLDAKGRPIRWNAKGTITSAKFYEARRRKRQEESESACMPPVRVLMANGRQLVPELPKLAPPPRDWTANEMKVDGCLKSQGVNIAFWPGSKSLRVIMDPYS